MDSKAAVKIIRDLGIYGLAHPDGCLCVSFAIHGISVDISCCKCGGGIKKIYPNFFGVKVRVHSQSLDVNAKDLQEVVDEVVKQLPEDYEIVTRLCDYNHDVNLKCVWCDRDREHPSDYLCLPCKSKPEVTDRFPLNLGGV